MKPAKCVICGLPTERRLTRNLGVCRKCEPPEPWKEEAQ
jgi:hypothetical protein